MEEDIQNMATSVVTQLIEDGFKAAQKSIGKISAKYNLTGSSQKYTQKMEKRYNSMRILGMSEPVLLRDIFVRVNILEDVTAHDRISVEELEEDFD